MKRLINVLAVVILLVCVTAAFAADKAKVGISGEQAKAKASVNCCMKGQCVKSASADQCKGAGGKVVKDCAECK